MIFKTKPVALKTISARILAGVASALLFMTTAEATIVTTDEITGVIYIDFTGSPEGGYYNEYLVDAFNDSDLENQARLPVRFLALVTGEYYTPTLLPGDVPGGDPTKTYDQLSYDPALSPSDWTMVNAGTCDDGFGGTEPCDPDFEEIGVYVSNSDIDSGGGLGLSSTEDDLFADDLNDLSPDLDGCQDFSCSALSGLLWEGLKFSFYTDVDDSGDLTAGDTPLVVTLTHIGFNGISASDNEDYNLTVINGTGEVAAYTDKDLRQIVPGVQDPDDTFREYALDESQDGNAFRVWVDSEEDDFRITGLKVEIQPVPLPASLPLMAGGLLSLFGLMRRRAKK